MKNTITKFRSPPARQAGFTLLEVLVVIFILGLLAAMAWPAMGIMDDRARREATGTAMERIRRAILGDPDRFDARGRQIIGGYVGDLHKWPDLWEARAETRPDFAGRDWDDPAGPAPGLGQGPGFALDPALVFFRPSGQFEAGVWRWHRPFRKLGDDPAGTDHTGGLETENEGQPRGLWTRYVEELPFDIPGRTVPGETESGAWKGPYLAPPRDRTLADSGHAARTDADYAALAPIWHPSGPHANHETWDDGDNSPGSGELGEHFDEKENFRLHQTDGLLSDGWGRAFRFFITADPDHAGSTVFWIVSEGPDGEATYPTKGTCTDHAWSVNAADTMGRAYDENDRYNVDNIVLKLYARDWEAVFEQAEQERVQQARRDLARIRTALVGAAPLEANTGFTGDLTRLPRLFRWEDNGTPADPDDDYWDDEDGAGAYTKGQPRGLWTGTPNRAAAGDNLPASVWGIGRRLGYCAVPAGTGAAERLIDPWGRELLFFKDTTRTAFLILSRGKDGQFEFGTVNAAKTEPAAFTENVDVTAYDPAAAVNTDNVHTVVALSDWRPGFFTLPRFVVTNAVLGDPADGTTRARFFRSDGAPVAGVDLLVPAALTDEDGDLALDDWAVGDGTPLDPAFNYNDTTAEKAATGARYLVFWNDADNNGAIDSGERHYPVIYNVTAAAGTGLRTAVSVDTGAFWAVP